MLYQPPTSVTYEFGQVQSGRYVLGTWETYAVCMKRVAYYCVSRGSFPLIAMVGTSGGSTGSTPSSGNGDNPPPPPPPRTTTTPPTTPPDLCKRMGTTAYTYPARGTGYYPANTAMEGGFYDRIGNPLKTLQDYLAGRVDYVSVAMDQHTFPYGTELCIPELEQRYGRQIIFKVVDTGSAFTGMGTSRIDISTANTQASYDNTVNGSLTLVSSVPEMQ
mgnify:FL=1